MCYVHTIKLQYIGVPTCIIHAACENKEQSYTSDFGLFLIFWRFLNYPAPSAKGSENAMSPTAKKPLIIKVLMKKRILFCNIYKHWTIADWRKVMFCNERTSRLVLKGYKLVRRPSGVSRYDSRYIIKTVKHPKSVMVWGYFSGDKGRGGLYFFP